MRNTMADLNNYLFEEIENLQASDELQGEALKTATTKALTIAKLGEVIVKNASVQLKAARFAKEYNVSSPIPIGIEDKETKKAGFKKVN